MCGILFYLCNCDFNLSEIINRGPDNFNKVSIKDKFTFIGCVLHHQGFNVTSQPLLFKESLLLWNGENYDNDYGNDGEQLLQQIAALSEVDAMHVLASVNGPFSTIYYNNDSGKICFGRDLLGRRSLLCGMNVDNEIVVLSSVLVEGCNHVYKWVELPAVGLYTGSLTKDGRLSNICLHVYDFYSLEYSSNELARVGLTDISVAGNSLLTNCISTIHDDDNLSREMAVDALLSVLEQSVSRRVNNVHGQCSQCLLTRGFTINRECTHSKLAVLFSGGVDSAVVAALADRFVCTADSIDLLNVAFHTSYNDNTDSADRISALICHKELININPSRKWNFVKIDIYPDELKLERANRIAKLIQPCDSVLDDSIGCALWFAARGQGRLLSNDTHYVSPARVVLTGIGADELMAGYSRHRNIYEKYGYETLTIELHAEIRRIASRNMGRDDRVLSCHSREGRFPFLDRDVVSFLESLPITLRCDLTKERGVGEKMLLRLVARDCLRLTQSSGNLKRAIQFGSKIAKIDRLGKGGKASQKCDRLDIE